jgi:hypothetical protein
MNMPIDDKIMRLSGNGAQRRSRKSRLSKQKQRQLLNARPAFSRKR